MFSTRTNNEDNSIFGLDDAYLASKADGVGELMERPIETNSP